MALSVGTVATGVATSGPWFGRRGRKLPDAKSGLRSARPRRSDPAIVDARPDCVAERRGRDGRDVLGGSSDSGCYRADGRGRSVEAQQAGAWLPGNRTVGVGGRYGSCYCFASIP